MKIEHNGFVVVNGDGFILEWSFQFYKKDAIHTLVKDSMHDWKYWRKQGMRCVRATRSISTLINL